LKEVVLVHFLFLRLMRLQKDVSRAALFLNRLCLEDINLSEKLRNSLYTPMCGCVVAGAP
jgi:hypothetical protein